MTIKRTLRDVSDFGRAVIAATLIVSAGYISASAQLPSAPIGGGTVGVDSFIPWALQQGGALAVLVIVLFFYRRDWKTAVEFWKDQNATRDVLVKEATKAQVETAAALREATIVIHGLKRVMQEQYPGRRFGDSVEDDRR